MARPEHVTFRIESHSPSGIDLLPDVLRQLTAMVKLLTEFAKDPRYSKVEVVEISKQSPLEAQLRVVTIKESTDKSHKAPVIRRSNEPFVKLERTIKSIRSNARKLDVTSLTAVSDFAKQLRQDVATIETPRGSMVIDASIIVAIDSCLGPRYFSRGSITGILEGVNVHTKPWSFTIYPEVGPPRVKCTFDEELFPEVQRAIRKVVTVYGQKEFRSESPWPTAVEASSIELRQGAVPGAWLTLADELSALWDRSDETERLMLLEDQAA